MTRRIVLLIFGLLNTLFVCGQRHDNLRPLFIETTSYGGTYYRTYYDKLTTGLSWYPEARTFRLTTFPEVTSIEETEKNSYTLFYRGFKERVIKNSNGDTVGYKKPKEIIKSERTIDTLLAKTLQRLFEKAISNTSHGDRDIIMTHPTFYYFYTWVVGQGIICGKGEAFVFQPKTDRLIKLHDNLVEYSKSKDIDKSDNLRLVILDEAESLVKEYK